MKNSTLKLVVVAFLCSPALSLASKFPDYPTTTILHSDDGAKNSIQINCIPNRNEEILICQFFQMSLSYELNPENLVDEINKEVNKIRSNKEYLGKDPIKEIKTLCLTKGKDNKKIKLHFNSMKSGPNKEHLKKVIDVMNTACTVNTLKQANNVIIDMVRLQKQWSSVTCKVWPNTWEESFKYKSTIDYQYWVSRSEPTGSCGVINISTLKKDGDYFWKYESRRIVTNKESSSSLVPCNKINDRTIVYSWRPKKHVVNCKELKFGF